MFFKGSRYAKVDDLTLTHSKGREVAYKATRFITTPDARIAHAVREGERLDHIAYRYYKDAERFWRICDANEAMWPDDLVAEAGEKIRIPSSED